jgi:hypothetical protein
MSSQSHETSQLTCSTQSPKSRRRRLPTSRVWVNWALAALTVLVAAGVVIFAASKVVDMAVCSSAPCPDPGSNSLVYTVLLYGAPLVATATVITSIFTANRRRGVAVPLCGLALLVSELTATAILFRS